MDDFVNKIKEIYLPKRYQKNYANKIHHNHMPKKKYFAERNPMYKIPKSIKVKRVKPKKPMMKHKKITNYKTNPVGDYFLQNQQQPTLFATI